MALLDLGVRTVAHMELSDPDVLAWALFTALLFVLLVAITAYHVSLSSGSLDAADATDLGEDGA